MNSLDNARTSFIASVPAWSGSVARKNQLNGQEHSQRTGFDLFKMVFVHALQNVSYITELRSLLAMKMRPGGPGRVRIPLQQLRFGTLAIPFTPLCQCLSEETLKAVGPLSMPGEVKKIPPVRNGSV